MNTLINTESRKENSNDTSLNCNKSTEVDSAAFVKVTTIFALIISRLSFNENLW